MLTADTMRKRLAQAVKAAGGQKAWADANGVSAAYVCDCLQGRRAVGEAISRPLGYVPVTMYHETVEHLLARKLPVKNTFANGKTVTGGTRS